MFPISDKVLDYLYLGTFEAIKDITFLKQNNIQCIISIVTEEVPKFDDIEYKQIHEPDGPDTDLSKYFDDICRYIHIRRCNKKSVFIHCQAGISRSATIALAYLMVILKLNYTDAFNYLHSKRSIISPRGGFMLQLRDFCQPKHIKLHEELMAELYNISQNILKDDITDYELFCKNEQSNMEKQELARIRSQKRCIAASDDNRLDCDASTSKLTILSSKRPESSLIRDNSKISIDSKLINRPKSSIIRSRGLLLEPLDIEAINRVESDQDDN